MLCITSTTFVLLINSVLPVIDSIAVRNKVWRMSLSVMLDMKNEEFWNQKSISILSTRLSILTLTRPNGSESILLKHIALRNNDPSTKNAIEKVYPVYGVLSHYDSRIVDNIFVHLSSLDKIDQESKRVTVYLCHMLLRKIYDFEKDGKAILNKRIQREIDSRPKESNDSLIALLKLAGK